MVVEAIAENRVADRGHVGAQLVLAVGVRVQAHQARPAAVARNFRCGRVGEIDLIVRKGDFFIFAEIKARMTESYGGALYAISEKKKNRMRRTAGYFVDSSVPPLPRGSVFRFDLVSVGDDGVEWIPDIIR